MIEKLINLLSSQFYPIFIASMIVIGLLSVGVILRNRKISIPTLILEVITIGGFTYAVYNRYKYDGKLELILGIYVFAAFITNLILYLLVYTADKKNDKIVYSTAVVEDKILGYLNSHGKLIYYTDEFFKLLKVNNKKELTKAIKNVTIDKVDVSLKEFLKQLTDNVEKNYSVVFELQNSKIVALELSKRKIINNGKLLGFILLNQKQQSHHQEVIAPKLKSNVLDIINEAAMVFDADNNKYQLNQKMMKALELTTPELLNLNQYIYVDDLKMLDKRAKNNGEKSKIYYRLNTSYRPMWVVENTSVVGDKVTRVIRETDFKSKIYQFKDYGMLVREIENLVSVNQNFYLFTISLENLKQIKERVGKELSMVLATNYFSLLANEIKDLQVYELGYYKFAFIIRNDELYNKLIRELQNNSILLNAKVSFNEVFYDLENFVGIFEKNKVDDRNAGNIINYALEALKLASDPNYTMNYSIYFYHKQTMKFDSKEVDLSENFLDNILNSKE